MIRSLFAAAVFAATGLVSAQNAPREEFPVHGGAIPVEETETEAEVLAVNRVARSMTIKDEDGEKVLIKVPRNIKGYDKLKMGSRLKVRYVKAVALSIEKPGLPYPGDEETLRLAPRSGPPSEAVIATNSVTGEVEDIDRGDREMTITKPDGATLRLQVPENTPGFDDAEEGELALVQYTEALAVALTAQNLLF